MPVANDAPKNPLLETGTRFSHLAEIEEIWANGLEAVTNSLTKFQNTKDELKKKQLEGALFLLKTYINKLADYDTKQWRLREEINRIPPTKWREGSDGSKTVSADQEAS